MLARKVHVRSPVSVVSKLLQAGFPISAATVRRDNLGFPEPTGIDQNVDFCQEHGPIESSKKMSRFSLKQVNRTVAIQQLLSRDQIKKESAQ